jgi:hypothetical protein
MTTALSRQPDLEVLAGIHAEVDAIARRATDTRWRLNHGQAVTGVTGLIDIEYRCRDVLALLETLERR